MELGVSILDCSSRVEGVLELNKTDINYIHIDVMDGEFVNNKNFMDVKEVSAINMVTKYPLDVHLMMNNPLNYIKRLKNMNIEFITIHLEIEEKEECFKLIKKLGYKVGLAIKPNTRVEELEPYLDYIDMILVMSVEPGIGGQKFIEGTVKRINEIKKLIKDRNICINVDGGINTSNIYKLVEADIIVVGSYISKSNNYKEAVEEVLGGYRNGRENTSIDDNDSKVEVVGKGIFYLGIISLVVVSLVLVYIYFFR